MEIPPWQPGYCPGHELDCSLLATFEPPLEDATIRTATSERTGPSLDATGLSMIGSNHFEWLEDPIMINIYTDIVAHPDADDTVKQLLPYLMEKAYCGGIRQSFGAGPEDIHLTQNFNDLSMTSPAENTSPPGNSSDTSSPVKEADSGANNKHSGLKHAKIKIKELTYRSSGTMMMQRTQVFIKARIKWHGVEINPSDHDSVQILYKLERNLRWNPPVFSSEEHRLHTGYRAGLRHDFVLAKYFSKQIIRETKLNRKCANEDLGRLVIANVLEQRDQIEVCLRRSQVFQDVIKDAADLMMAADMEREQLRRKACKLAKEQRKKEEHTISQQEVHQPADTIVERDNLTESERTQARKIRRLAGKRLHKLRIRNKLDRAFSDSKEAVLRESKKTCSANGGESQLAVGSPVPRGRGSASTTNGKPPHAGLTRANRRAYEVLASIARKKRLAKQKESSGSRSSTNSGMYSIKEELIVNPQFLLNVNKSFVQPVFDSTITRPFGSTAMMNEHEPMNTSEDKEMIPYDPMFPNARPIRKAHLRREVEELYKGCLEAGAFEEAALYQQWLDQNPPAAAAQETINAIVAACDQHEQANKPYNPAIDSELLASASACRSSLVDTTTTPEIAQKTIDAIIAAQIKYDQAEEQRRASEEAEAARYHAWLVNQTNLTPSRIRAIIAAQPKLTQNSSKGKLSAVDMSKVIHSRGSAVAVAAFEVGQDNAGGRSTERQGWQPDKTPGGEDVEMAED